MKQEKIINQRRLHVFYLTVAITSLIAIGVFSELFFPYEIISESLEVDNLLNYQISRFWIFTVAIGLMAWLFALGFYIGKIKGVFEIEESI